MDELKIIGNVFEGMVKICRIMGTGNIEDIIVDFWCFSFESPGRGVQRIDPTIAVVAPSPLTIVVGTGGGRSRSVGFFPLLLVPILFRNVSQRENKNNKSDHDGIPPLVCSTPIVPRPVELDDDYGHVGCDGDNGCAEGLCLDFEFHPEGPFLKNRAATFLLLSSFAAICWGLEPQ
jgi:hypothetical protein